MTGKNIDLQYCYYVSFGIFVSSESELACLFCIGGQ